MNAILVGKYLLNPKVDEFQLQLFQINIRGSDPEVAGVIEHKFHGTRGSQTAITFIEVRSDICYGSGIIIGGSFYQYCNAMRGITFVKQLFKVPLRFVGSTFNGAFHIILGHIYGFGVLNHRPQS